MNFVAFHLHEDKDSYDGLKFSRGQLEWITCQNTGLKDLFLSISILSIFEYNLTILIAKLKAVEINYNDYLFQLPSITPIAINA